MDLSAQALDYLATHNQAAMITVGPDGNAKVARVGVTVVDGKLWSSGTEDRVRTARLRQDPRCTMFVFDPGFSWLTLEGTVTILDGPGAPALNLRLLRLMQDRPSGPISWFGGELEEEAFLEAMVQEKRLIYEFEPLRTYGMQ